MRFLIVAILLLMLDAGRCGLSAERAAAKGLPAGAKLPPQEVTEEGRYDGAVANCVQMWDRGTHMTQRQWLHACKRVQNRLQSLPLQ